MIKIALNYLSPTAINAYLSCPRKFFLRYIRKLKTKPSIYLIRGSIVHRVIERFHRESGFYASEPTAHKTVIRLLEIFEEQWKNAGFRLDSLDLSPQEIQDYHDESQIMVINFGSWIHKSKPSPPARVEARLFSKKLGLMGIIDAVYRSDNESVLVDYKTSRKSEITSDIERQAALYALLWKDINGSAPIEVWIHFLNSEDDPSVIHIDEHLLSYAKITLESIKEKTLSMDEADYPCTCGGYCQRDFITD